MWIWCVFDCVGIASVCVCMRVLLFLDVSMISKTMEIKHVSKMKVSHKIARISQKLKL